MNEGVSRWWIVGLAALGLVLALAWVSAQTEAAQAGVGLMGLVLVAVCLISLLLVVAAVWPGFSLRAKASLESSPGKTFVVGLVNYVFLGAIALVTMNLGAAAMIGVVLSGVLLIGTLLGLPAAAGLVGERLYSLRARQKTRWSEIVAGGVALYLAVLVPAVGWFLVLPALCLWSFGAAALTLVSRQAMDRAEIE